jgi:hypothetical protein
MLILEADHFSQEPDNECDRYWEKYFLLLKKLDTNPVTYKRVGIVASEGPPYFAGSYSKEEGLDRDSERDRIAFLMGIKIFFDNSPEQEITVV